MADIVPLLGQPIGSSDVQALLCALGPWQIKAYPSVGKHPASKYHTAKMHGLQLCFESEAGAEASRETLSAVHLFNEAVDGFSRYQVVELLGEPHNKGGSNVPVWIEYQDKGVQINFKGLSFEDRTNPIASITLFPPDATAAASGPDAEAKGIH